MDIMSRWITCDFTSFLTLVQSYEDDGKMIRKGCVQWKPSEHSKSELPGLQTDMNNQETCSVFN